MEKIGRFDIGEEIGRGSMGRVYRAVDPNNNQPVAIKVINLFYEDDPDAQRRFEREAKLVQNLDHPHIVKAYEFGTYDGFPYIVFEWIQGQTLKQRLRKEGRFSVEESSIIVKQLASALDYAHQNGVTHRDVKPANIMITEDNHVKLVDFGIAQAEDRTKTTANSAIPGTLLYMSPEQIAGYPATSHSDIYSLALVFYEMVAGAAPFAGLPINELRLKKINDIPPPVTEVNPSLPLSIEDVLIKALRHNSDKRYPTANAFVSALHEKRSIPTILWKKYKRRLSIAIAVLFIALLGWTFIQMDIGTVQAPTPTSTPTPTPTPTPTFTPTPTPIFTREEGISTLLRPDSDGTFPVSSDINNSYSFTRIIVNPAMTASLVFTNTLTNDTPILAGGGKLFVRDTQTVYVIDSAEKQLNYALRFTTPIKTYALSNLSAEMHLVVVTEDGQIFVFKAVDGTLEWEVEDFSADSPKFLSKGNSDLLYLVAGKNLYTLDTNIRTIAKLRNFSDKADIIFPPLIIDDKIVTVHADKTLEFGTFTGGQHAITLETDLNTPPFLLDNQIIIGSDEGLHSVPITTTATSNQALVETQLLGGKIRHVVAMKQTAYVITVDNNLVVIDIRPNATDRILRSSSLDERVSAAPILNEEMLLLTTETGSVISLDLTRTTDQLNEFQFDFKETILMPALPIDRNLFIQTQSGIWEVKEVP